MKIGKYKVWFYNSFFFPFYVAEIFIVLSSTECTFQGFS